MIPIALDSETLQEQLGALLAGLTLAPHTDAAAAPTAASASDDSPETLLAAFGQLIDVMRRLESEYHRSTPQTTALRGEDASELGAYAFALLDKTEQALGAAQADYAMLRAALDIGFAHWVARHGGTVQDLTVLVDRIALLANRTQTPEMLADLATVMLRVIDTAAPAYRQDLDNANPGRPWRLLHLNLGIVATRARRPDLMEQAFARLVTHLPQDAAQFFHQGMQQLERIEYPEAVRAIMQDYFQRWGGKPALH